MIEMKTKKKWMWGIAVAVSVAALSVGLYKFFAADDYRLVLPPNPVALATMDWVRLSEENDMSIQDWEKLLPEELKTRKAGIDWSKKMYAFVTSNDYGGLLAAIGNEAELRRFLDEMADKTFCTPVEDYGGFSWTVWDDNWMVGLGHGALLVMGPGLKSDMDALRHYMSDCFGQKKEESGMSSPLFTQLDGGRDAFFRAVSRLDLLPDFRGAELLKELSKHVNLNDVYVCAGLDLTPHGVTAEAEISSKNSDINRYCERLDSLCKPLDGGFARRVPKDALAWACINVDGNSLLEMLRQNPVVRTALIGLNIGVDADMIIRSIKGEVAVTVPSSVISDSGHFLLTAHLAEKDFLKETTYWKESAAENEAVVFRNFGNNRFYMAGNGMQAYFGVKGETLYVTPNEELEDWADSPETETLSEWESRIRDCRFFLWVNVDRLTLYPFADKSRRNGLDTWPDWFDSVALHSSDARRLTLELHSRGNRNLLKDLLKQWTK